VFCSAAGCQSNMNTDKSQNTTWSPVSPVDSSIASDPASWNSPVSPVDSCIASDPASWNSPVSPVDSCIASDPASWNSPVSSVDSCMCGGIFKYESVANLNKLWTLHGYIYIKLTGIVLHHKLCLLGLKADYGVIWCTNTDEIFKQSPCKILKILCKL